MAIPTNSLVTSSGYLPSDRKVSVSINVFVTSSGLEDFYLSKEEINLMTHIGQSLLLTCCFWQQNP